MHRTLIKQNPISSTKKICGYIGLGESFIFSKCSVAFVFFLRFLWNSHSEVTPLEIRLALRSHDNHQTQIDHLHNILEELFLPIKMIGRLFCFPKLWEKGPFLKFLKCLGVLGSGCRTSLAGLLDDEVSRLRKRWFIWPWVMVESSP